MGMATATTRSPSLVSFSYDGVYRVAAPVGVIQGSFGNNLIQMRELIRGEIQHPEPRVKSYTATRIKELKTLATYRASA